MVTTLVFSNTCQETTGHEIYSSPGSSPLMLGSWNRNTLSWHNILGALAALTQAESESNELRSASALKSPFLPFYSRAINWFVG